MKSITFIKLRHSQFFSSPQFLWSLFNLLNNEARWACGDAPTLYENLRHFIFSEHYKKSISTRNWRDFTQIPMLHCLRKSLKILKICKVSKGLQKPLSIFKETSRYMTATKNSLIRRENTSIKGKRCEIVFLFRKKRGKIGKISWRLSNIPKIFKIYKVSWVSKNCQDRRKNWHTVKKLNEFSLQCSTMKKLLCRTAFL